MGTLAYFLYTYASMALGATYNELFLLYITLFTSIDLPTLGSRFNIARK